VIELRRAGEHGVVLELKDNAAAVRVARGLASEPGLVDVVPGHRTVLVTWEEEPPELIELAEAAVGDD
jgi:allophanate hydrolase subunit 1